MGDVDICFAKTFTISKSSDVDNRRQDGDRGGGSAFDTWSRQRPQFHNIFGGMFIQWGHFSFKVCMGTVIFMKTVQH